jgi:hypothetical protein
MIFRLMISTLGAFTLTLLLVPYLAQAAGIQITAKCHYVMGDNDTKNDARQLCFLQAKRQALEKAGVFIQSQVKVSDGRLSKDQISTFSAAILSVEITNEKISFNGQNTVIQMTVRANVDLADVKKRLSQISGSKSIQSKISNQQRQLRTLETEVADLRKLLNKANPAEAKTLRKRRNVVFKRIDDLANLKISIVQKIQSSSSRLLKYVELGMIPDEVLKLAGKPRAISGNDWNYGQYWVVFEGGIASCIVRDTSAPNPCANYRSNYKSGLIK